MSYNPPRPAPVVYKNSSDHTIHHAVMGILGTIIAITLIVIAVFVGIDAFREESSSDEVTTEIITSDSNYNITINHFATCLGDATVRLYRLHRVANLITGQVQGTCYNTSGAGTFMDLDFQFTQLPLAFRCPTGDGADPNVLATGSALVAGQDIAAVVQGEANTDTDEIDVELRFSSTVPDGSNVEFTTAFIYKADSCP
jgi:hypothetical protein